MYKLGFIIPFRNSKFTFFFILALLFTYYGSYSIDDDSTNSYIHSMVMFAGLGIIDIAHIRYQRSIEYTQLILTTLSLKKKYFRLICQELFGLKLIVFLPYLVSLILFGEMSISFVIYYLIAYFSYCNTSLLLKHLARRFVSISVILKQILGISFFPLMISMNPHLYSHFYENTMMIKMIILFVFFISVLASYFIFRYLKNKKPIYDLAIINNYNKKYWY